MKKIFGLIIVNLLLAGFASAQQKVYAPPPPADSAFVRIIHANMDASNMAAQIGDVNFAELEYGSIGAYQVVPAGSYEGVFGTMSGLVELSAGNYYTVAVATELAVMQDPVNSNLAKTMLVLYNFSASDMVDMKTADGSTPVISDVAMSSMNNILVNPIQVDLAAFSGADSVNSFAGLSLASGATYSMVVMGSVDALSANWALNEVVQ